MRTIAHTHSAPVVHVTECDVGEVAGDRTF